MTAWERLSRAVDNPIIVKDGVSRMRNWRAPVILTLYVGLLGACGYAVFLLFVLFSSNSGPGSAAVGALVFSALAFIQVTLVCLFAPALAAGAISGERERQTLEILLVSRVTALGIVWGKLVASVAFMLLLILAALPLFAAVFLFGGIDFQQFAVTQAVTVTTAVTVASVSLFLSSAFRRTLTSTVGAYAATFAGLVGTLALGLLLTTVEWQHEGAPGAAPAAMHPLVFANPLYALNVLLNNPNGAPESLGRLLGVFFLIPGVGDGAGPTLEPWQATILAQAALVALSLFGAVRLVRGRRASQPRARADEPETAAELDLDPEPRR